MAGLLLEAGELGRADELLVRAYELAGHLPPERQRRFRVTSTATALYRARLDGDLEEALSAARLALSEDWDRSVAVEVRALALANIGIAEFWAGDVDQALERLQAAAGLALEFGSDYVLFVAESYLAAVHARQGRLDDAHSRARTAIQLAERRGWADVAHIAHRVRRRSRRSTSGGTSSTRPSVPATSRCEARRAERRAAARAPMVGADPGEDPRRSRRSHDGDSTILRGGDPGPTLPDWLRVSASLLEGEMWLALGEPARARSVLEAVSTAEPVRLGDRAGEARAGRRRAGGGAARDRRLPGRRPRRAHAGHANRGVDDRRDRARRDPRRAGRAARHRARARPRRAARVHEPDPPLRTARAVAPAPPDRQGHRPPRLRRRAPVGARGRSRARRPGGDPLLEPLSERELAVLRFLPTLMSNAEIASEMFVSVNTVKTHLKHIYRKLDVSERRDAVRRGRELHLLSPGLGDPRD